ncbi:hypothetical protein NY08_2472 [Rhodococcus sp. B7740]|nr:hypothetical protein NY08_2472 [Rhodococcus sp. B7740]
MNKMTPTERGLEYLNHSSQGYSSPTRSLPGYADPFAIDSLPPR